MDLEEEEPLFGVEGGPEAVEGPALRRAGRRALEVGVHAVLPVLPELDVRERASGHVDLEGAEAVRGEPAGEGLPVAELLGPEIALRDHRPGGGIVSHGLSERHRRERHRSCGRAPGGARIGAEARLVLPLLEAQVRPALALLVQRPAQVDAPHPVHEGEGEPRRPRGRERDAAAGLHGEDRLARIVRTDGRPRKGGRLGGERRRGERGEGQGENAYNGAGAFLHDGFLQAGAGTRAAGPAMDATVKAESPRARGGGETSAVQRGEGGVFVVRGFPKARSVRGSVSS